MRERGTDEGEVKKLMTFGVRIACRNQTQNQGEFRVVVVYSITGSVSQVIKNTEPNVWQRIVVQ